ncbi:AT-hook motif nuclear-localized protein 15-like [Diospyros lotus]|uniref:AT-hook motif nuclear-localized protein 15-like n=1 Tax=Diospyros lotus TaxID=55363 RepID=UPI00225C1652|nr:AT-hook motif nuclear-localized protein 15-like [Diospyros lotus]
MAEGWWVGNVAMDPMPSSSMSSLQLISTYGDDYISGSNNDPNPKTKNVDPKNEEGQEKDQDQSVLEVSEPTTIARRPRGRPPSSKNKSKPPTIITKEMPNTLFSSILEIGNGADIVKSISTFAERRHCGVAVLSGSGIITDVTLQQPGGFGGVIVLQGRFEILSLSGVFLPVPSPVKANGLTVYLASGQGQVVGGVVAGPLVTSGPVIVVAGTFANAEYERLPMKKDEETMKVTIETSQAHGLAYQSPSLLVHNVPANVLRNAQMSNHQPMWA